MNPPVVLIAGAGPTGLTLGIELARRGVPVRVVDRSAEPFAGSRGDGLSPRTLEVFGDLGVLDTVLASGIGAPLIRRYAGGEVVWEGRMADPVEPTPDVPHPNPWFVPQWRTEQILCERLAELGVPVEFGTALTGFESGDEGVTCVLERAGEVERVRTASLVGADGGGSTVRRGLGITFAGTTDESIRVLLADVRTDALDHRFGHGWTLENDGFVGLIPLAGADDTYVLSTTAGDDVPETDLEGSGLAYMQRLLDRASGRDDIRLRDLSWISLWRPNIRLAERFRAGRVFLAGDAAHVHPPTGGQGLNTGVQDAYNLGWKLAAVLGGAHDRLLDSYETERRLNAARVLGISTELLDKTVDGAEDAHVRGEETRQLDVGYRGGPLSRDDRPDGPDAGTEPEMIGGVRAGDRAPDAPCRDAGGRPVRLFELFGGTHWTLLRRGPTAPDVEHPAVRSYLVDAAGSLRDVDGQLAAAYGLPEGYAGLIRPDGYVGLVTANPATIGEYLDGVAVSERDRSSLSLRA